MKLWAALNRIVRDYNVTIAVHKGDDDRYLVSVGDMTRSGLSTTRDVEKAVEGMIKAEAEDEGNIITRWLP